MNKKNIFILLLIVITAGMGFELFRMKNHSEIPEALVPRKMKEGSRVFQSPYEMNQVNNTITKHTSEIQKCYKDHLTQNPETADGKINLDWNILKNGEVEKPEIISTDFTSMLINNCIVDVVESWVFPEPPGNQKVYISHVFNFKKVAETASNQPKKKS